MSKQAILQQTDFVQKALEMCIVAHAGQTDKSGDMYALHPIRVALSFPTSDPYCALLRTIGLLHDTVEDTDVTIDQIEDIFGRTVRDAVDVLIRREDQDYLKELIPCIASNALATRVKIADLLDNLDPNRRFVVTSADVERRERYYRALLILRGW